MSSRSTAAKGLDLSQVLTACLDELDAVGLDALSLRGVASRLGVKPPALYWYVRSKRDLLDRIATELWRPAIAAATVGADDDLPPWPTLMRTYASSLRASLTSRRDGARAASGAVIVDDTLLRSMEPTLARFAAAGMPVESLVALFQTTQHATVGFCINEQHRTLRQVDLGERARRLADAPHVAAIGPAVVGDADTRFARMVDLLEHAGRSVLEGS